MAHAEFMDSHRIELATRAAVPVRGVRRDVSRNTEGTKNDLSDYLV
jgi:hypothetical protein